MRLGNPGRMVWSSDLHLHQLLSFSHDALPCVQYETARWVPERRHARRKVCKTQQKPQDHHHSCSQCLQIAEKSEPDPYFPASRRICSLKKAMFQTGPCVIELSTENISYGANTALQHLTLKLKSLFGLSKHKVHHIKAANMVPMHGFCKKAWEPYQNASMFSSCGPAGCFTLPRLRCSNFR